MRDLDRATHKERLRWLLSRRNHQRPRAPRRAIERFEFLEPIVLLAMACPTISGFVFLDENSTNAALTNNGLFDAGEAPIAGASVELLDSSNQIVSTTTTDPSGAYSFGGTNPNSPTAPLMVTQTITLGNPANPNLPTNYTSQPFTPALQLFDPSLGTLQSVAISSDVSYDSDITVTNLSQGSPATGIQASINGSYTINGLGPELTITGTPSKSGTVPDLPPVSASGGHPASQTINLVAEDQQDPTLTSAQALAFFTASGGQTALTPTMTALGSGVANASNGNGTVSQSTFAAATLTITYTYIPAPECLIEPGTYTVVQTPEVMGVINGKESQPGTVFPSNGPPQSLTVSIASDTSNSTDNDFAKLTIPTTPTPTPTTPTPTPTTTSNIAPNTTTSPSPSPTPGAAPEVGAIMLRAPATGTKITRFGVHHQPTKLAVQFNGAVDAAQAGNPNNYFVALRGKNGIYGTADNLKVPIIAANYDPTVNTVLLTSSRRLNLHDHFALTVQLGTITASGDPSASAVLFGGRQELGGFVGDHGVGTELLPVPPRKHAFGAEAAPVASLGPLAAPAPHYRIPDPKVHVTPIGKNRAVLSPLGHPSGAGSGAAAETRKKS